MSTENEDLCLDFINFVTCMPCVSAVNYHFIEKDEDDCGSGSGSNDNNLFPCCLTSQSSSYSRSSSYASYISEKRDSKQYKEYLKRLKKQRRKRMIVSTLLCIFLPCVWCYPCLKGCHTLGNKICK